MAQTRSKRRTKHRGNAAGMIEARGRTGRPLTAEEKGQKSSKGVKGENKLNRRDKPPTWSSAFIRAMIAAILMVLVSVLLLHNGEVLKLFPFVLALYTPLSYYTDMWLYRRRLRQRAAAAGREQ